MQTFLEFMTENAKSPILAYEISDASHREIVKRFPPKYPEVLAHHITIKVRPKPTDTVPPIP